MAKPKGTDNTMAKKKDIQHNSQKKKDRQHNGQKKKDRQHNGQTKKDKQRSTNHYMVQVNHTEKWTKQILSKLPNISYKSTTPSSGLNKYLVNFLT